MIHNGSRGVFTRTQKRRRTFSPRVGGVRPASVFGIPLRVPSNSASERREGRSAVAAYAASLQVQRDARLAFRRARDTERFNAIAAKRKALAEQLEPST